MFGWSLPSNQSQPCHSPSLPPDRNPTIKSASFQNYNKILLISWEPLNPQDFYGPNFSYLVQWKRVEDELPRHFWEVVEIANGSNFAKIESDPFAKKEMPSFKPGSYVVQIVCRNGKGFSTGKLEPVTLILREEDPDNATLYAALACGGVVFLVGFGCILCILKRTIRMRWLRESFYMKNSLKRNTNGNGGNCISLKMYKAITYL